MNLVGIAALYIFILDILIGILSPFTQHGFVLSLLLLNFIFVDNQKILLHLKREIINLGKYPWLGVLDNLKFLGLCVLLAGVYLLILDKLHKFEVPTFDSMGLVVANCIFIPILEECFWRFHLSEIYRPSATEKFKNNSDKLYMVVSATMCTLYHFLLEFDPYRILTVFPFALYFALVFRRVGLYASIAHHILFNSVATIACIAIKDLS